MARKITTKAITDDAITADKIVAGAVVADIGAGTVTHDKLNLISTSSAPSLEAKGDGSSIEGKIQLNCHVNSHGVTLQSPPHSSSQSWTLKLPDNSPTAEKFLKVKSITGSGATATGQLEFAEEIGPLKVDSSNNQVGIGIAAGGNTRVKIGGTDSGGYATTIQLENDNASGVDSFVLTTDSNWTIQNNAGQGGLALGRAAASSDNTGVFIGADGLVVIGGHNVTLPTWISKSFSSGTGIHLMDAVSIGRGGDASNYNSEFGYEAGRRVIGWWQGQASSSGGSYLHLRTSLWGGGSPHGQSSYIMGGFQIKGHRYSTGSSVSDQTVYFHNWSGSTAPGYSMTNTGSWSPNNAVYVDSTGYCTIRLECGSYHAYFIDCHQIGLFYPVRDIRVTNEIYSGSTSI